MRLVGGGERMTTDEAAGLEPWERTEVVSWCRLLLESYHRWTGQELIERRGTDPVQAKALFYVPFVVVSHGNQDDPVLNYANAAALALWETTWERLTSMPSRLTAEPVNQAERARMLEQASVRGYIDDYRGVRISATGRRFLVEQALVWNVVDKDGRKRGQAATFSRWKPLGL